VRAANVAAAFALVVLLLCFFDAVAIGPDQLGILYRKGDRHSEEVARFYQRARHVPERNMLAVSIPDIAVMAPEDLVSLRQRALRRLPVTIEALLLVWTRPYAVACMSSTSAFTFGYDPAFCNTSCGRTAWSPLFDADRIGVNRQTTIRPAMQMPSDDVVLAENVIRRGVASDGTRPAGIAYLIVTSDALRNVRAVSYSDAVGSHRGKMLVRIAREPKTGPVPSVLTYYTGAARVRELAQLKFLAGGVGDSLTSFGGNLDQHEQTTVIDWLAAGATASYGTVAEPCNATGKFPSPVIFLKHYSRGDTLLEAYWKSVAMPGQGLFVGEPLAAPFRSPSS